MFLCKPYSSKRNLQKPSPRSSGQALLPRTRANYQPCDAPLCSRRPIQTLLARLRRQPGTLHRVEMICTRKKCPLVRSWLISKSLGGIRDWPGFLMACLLRDKQTYEYQRQGQLVYSIEKINIFLGMRSSISPHRRLAIALLSRSHGSFQTFPCWDDASPRRYCATLASGC